MKVAIFGATGLLGKYLTHAFAANGDAISGFGSKDVDIRKPQEVADTIRRLQPEWIILSAAYTDVDGCEKNPDLAFDTNTRGAIHVAEAAKSAGARLLFLSTDYVFDGAKTLPYETADAPNPRSVYGRSKTDAETEIMRILPAGCIVRSSWLFGLDGRCFPDTILKMAESRPLIEVVDDQRGSPTYAQDLAVAIGGLCRAGASGIVHASNRGECTWFEFARAIISGAALPTVVRPTTSDQFVRPAARPKYSVLSSTSLNGYSITMPAWQDALARYLKAWKARG